MRERVQESGPGVGMNAFVCVCGRRGYADEAMRNMDGRRIMKKEEEEKNGETQNERKRGRVRASGEQ